MDLDQAHRLYRVVRITGWTLDQIDDAPAHLLDQIIAIDSVYLGVFHQGGE